ncbi:MAG: hypothetical protein ACXVRA_10505 [Gaiellaceae bacterium]
MAGDREIVSLPYRFEERRAKCVWGCRDIDQRLHVWSAKGEHKRLKRGRYSNFDELFAMMYPEPPGS